MAYDYLRVKNRHDEKAKQCVLLTVSAFNNNDLIDVSAGIESIGASSKDVFHAINLVVINLDIDIVEKQISYSHNDPIHKLAAILERVVEIGLDKRDEVIQEEVTWGRQDSDVADDKTASATNNISKDNAKATATDKVNNSFNSIRSLFTERHWKPIKSILIDNNLQVDSLTLRLAMWKIESKFLKNLGSDGQEALDEMRSTYLCRFVSYYKKFDTVTEFVEYCRDVKKLSPEETKKELYLAMPAIKFGNSQSQKKLSINYLSPEAQVDFVREYKAQAPEKLRTKSLGDLVKACGLNYDYAVDAPKIDRIIVMLEGVAKKEVERLNKKENMPNDLATEFVKSRFLAVEGSKASKSGKPSVVREARSAKIFPDAMPAVHSQLKKIYPDYQPEFRAAEAKRHPRVTFKQACWLAR